MSWITLFLLLILTITIIGPISPVLMGVLAFTMIGLWGNRRAIKKWFTSE